MANKKISELTQLTTPDASDVFAVVDISATETKQITFTNLVTAITNLGGSFVNIATELVTSVASGSDITINLAQLAHSYTAITFVTRNGQVIMPNGNSSIPGSSWSKSGDTITVYNADSGDVYLVQYIYE